MFLCIFDSISLAEPSPFVQITKIYHLIDVFYDIALTKHDREMSAGAASPMIQTLLVRLPLAYYMSNLPNTNLTKIGLAAPVSTAVGVILNVGFFLYLSRKEKRETL